MAFLKVYTREATGDKYPQSLAGSIHFAFSEDGKEYTALNSNYGVLFALAQLREDNTIDAKDLREPKIYKGEGVYHIFAEKCNQDGTLCREDKVLMWTTTDFVSFGEQEYVSREQYQQEISGAQEVIEISDVMLSDIKDRWYPIYSVSAQVPETVTLADMEELEKVQAIVTYSDGSTDEKRVIWDTEGITKTDKGTYKVKGEIVSKPIVFPMAVGLADPVLFKWEGSWYFIATNDNLDDIGLYVRKADTVDGLFAEGIETRCILDYDEEKGFIQTFWAPEFHVIGGELYILFAVGGKQWAPQCHMMKLKKGGEIMNPEDWETPVRVKRQDGSFLTENGITLDMTYFKVKDTSYLAWSYRFGIGTSLDTGSMLYIATTDEKKPWVLTSEPVLLSRPLFGWENTQGTINNEGPYPLILDDKVYLAYSGGAACGYSYAVGYLTTSIEDDLLQIENWTKEPAPLLCSTYINGIDGPGHNSFFVDEDGKIIIAYHAQETDKFFKRCSTMHRVHIGKNGFPFLNMSAERDLAESLKNVELEVALTGN